LSARNHSNGPSANFFEKEVTKLQKQMISQKKKGFEDAFKIDSLKKKLNRQMQESRELKNLLEISEKYRS